VPSQLERLKPEEAKYRNENPRDLVAESIKSGYNPGPRSFINIMQYHRGLLHQRGHGWGALAKIAAKAAAPIIGQVVGGLLGGTQTGQGIQKGHGAIDSLLNAAIMANHMFGDKKASSSYFENGKLVSTTKAQSGGGRKKCVKRQQKGKGFITDLLKTGAKQALRAAAQTGLDVLDNKRSLKDVIKTHGIRAIKSTAQSLLARGGPRGSKKTPIKGAPTKVKRASRPKASRPLPKVPVNKKPQIKRPAIKRPAIKRPAIKRPAIKRPAIKRPAIKRPKGVLDIFD
jgi:hypothetical protein